MSRMSDNVDSKIGGGAVAGSLLLIWLSEILAMIGALFIVHAIFKPIYRTRSGRFIATFLMLCGFVYFVFLDPNFAGTKFKNPDTMLYMQMIGIMAIMGILTSSTAQNMASSLNSDIMFAATGNYRESYDQIIFCFILGLVLYGWLPGAWATGFLFVCMYGVQINLRSLWASVMQDASYLHGQEDYMVSKAQYTDVRVAEFMGDISRYGMIPVLIAFYAYNKQDVWLPYILDLFSK